MKVKSETILISVLIPTFNNGLYIKQTLESVINQTFVNLEILCIDDCSTDDTRDIIRKIALIDDRIKLISKPINLGVSAVRNEALSLVKGKYFCFVDGDDLIDENLLEKAYSLAESTNSDIVMWDYLSFIEQKEILNKKYLTSNLNNISEVDRVSLLKRPAFSWMKLINTKIATDLQVDFPVGLIREDIPMHWKLITCVNKIAVLPEILSFYRRNPLSLTHKNNETVLDIAPIMDIVMSFLKKNGLYEKYRDEFLRQQLNLLFGMYDNVENKYKKRALELIENRINDDHLNYIYSNKPLRKQAKYFYKSQNGNNIAKIKLFIWMIVRSLYRKIKST